MSKAEIIRILALGDSYTIGEGVPAEESWPEQLAEYGRNNGWDIRELQVIARTGWTTANLLNAIEKDTPQGKFDFVFLLIGVNNQYQGLDIGQYRNEFRQLLQLCFSFSGGETKRVIVLSIPDWSVTPFAAGHNRKRINNEIETFNRINHHEAVHAGARYVDITPESRRLGADNSGLAEDGLHPSATMYARWVDLIVPEMKKIIRMD